MTVAVAVCLVGGLNTVPALDLPRTFGLLPFFVAGLGDDPRAVRLAGPSPRARRRGGADGARLRGRDASPPAASARSGSTGAPATPTWACRSGSAPSVRLGLLVVAGALALGALSLIPRSQRWFTPLGAASLVVYLFHGFAVKGAEYAGVGGLSERDPVTAFLAVTGAAVLGEPAARGDPGQPAAQQARRPDLDPDRRALDRAARPRRTTGPRRSRPSRSRTATSPGTADRSPGRGTPQATAGPRSDGTDSSSRACSGVGAAPPRWAGSHGGLLPRPCGVHRAGLQVVEQSLEADAEAGGALAHVVARSDVRRRADEQGDGPPAAQVHRPLRGEDPLRPPDGHRHDRRRRSRGPGPPRRASAPARCTTC